MKKFAITFLALSAFCLSLCGQTKVRFMPQWVAQSQFAGYYAAIENGFYAEEGLDVELVPLDFTASADVISYLERGKVDLCSYQFISALKRRCSDTPNLVDVMQVSTSSGIMCVSREPISGPEDLRGKKVGRWRTGSADIADMCFTDKQIEIDWIPFLRNIDLYVSGALDATLAFSFGEYVSLLLSQGIVPPENCFRFADLGYNFPEDGLFTTSEYLKAHPDVVDAFARASRKGWEWVAANKEQAVDIVMKYVKDAKLVSNRTIQTLMLDEMLKLQGGEGAFSVPSEAIFNKACSSLYSLGLIDKMLDYKSFVR